MTNSQIPREALLILVIACFVAILVVTAFIVNFWLPFLKQRSYLKMEIRRTDGEEKKYYKKQLEIFYASHVPFVRHFMFKKKSRKKHK